MSCWEISRASFRLPAPLATLLHLHCRRLSVSEPDIGSAELMLQVQPGRAPTRSTAGLIAKAIKQDESLRPDARTQWEHVLKGRLVIMAGDSTTEALCEHIQKLVQVEPCPIVDNFRKGTSATLFAWAKAAAPRTGRGAICCIFTGAVPMAAGVNTALPQVRVRPNKAACQHQALDTRTFNRGAFYPWVHVNIGDTLHCLLLAGVLRANDVVVANTGLHHNNLGSLNTSLDSFVRFFHAAKASRVCTTWRETLPQHWATPGGEYLLRARMSILHAKRNGSTPCCVPLPEAQRNGTRRQKWNEFAEPRLWANGVPVLRVYHLFSGLDYLHKACYDCMHYIEAATHSRAVIAMAVGVTRALAAQSLGRNGWGDRGEAGRAGRSAKMRAISRDDAAALQAWHDG